MATARTNATVVNRLGLHARPAMSFVEAACGFSSTVTVLKGEQSVDGKSIMQMMMLAATKGTALVIVTEGDDAEQACAQLKKLIESGFDED